MKHAGMNRDFLLALSDVDLDEVIYNTLAERIDPDRDTIELLLSFSPATRAVFTLCVLDGEVSNGGFIQYFYNTQGKYIQYLTDTFAIPGTQRFLGIVQQAMTQYLKSIGIFEQAIYKDMDDPELGLEGLGMLYEEPSLQGFNELDRQFFSMKESIFELAEIRGRFVKDNIADILTDIDRLTVSQHNVC